MRATRTSFESLSTGPPGGGPRTMACLRRTMACLRSIAHGGRTIAAGWRRSRASPPRGLWRSDPLGPQRYPRFLPCACSSARPPSRGVRPSWGSRASLSGWPMVERALRERNLRVVFTLGTFHAAVLVAVLVVVLYANGGLASLLSGLSTIAGLALFGALWLTTVWSTDRTLR